MPFTILRKDKKTKARRGVLTTPHGTVQTPSYVIVATQGSIKCLIPADIKKTKTQLVISNTYHLWPEAKKPISYELKAKSLVTKLLGVSLPTMTDSGGFQVFSLGAGRNHSVSKVSGKIPNSKFQIPDSPVRITEKGVYFKMDGKKRFLSPEISMAIQERIGADIIFAFDECTSPLHDMAYTKKSMERTHRWAIRSLKAHKRKDQMLYGIVQGGRSSSLRKQSAKFIGALPFAGFGIGGSFGKEEMAKTLKATVPLLPEEKPRHLLGIGTIRDLFVAVENGIDTFDCVIPTREARHARIYAQKGAYDIRKGSNKNNRFHLAPACKCPACAHGITRAKLHALFKSKNPTAQRYATLHNVWFFNTLMERIRRSIENGTFGALKKQFG